MARARIAKEINKLENEYYNRLAFGGRAWELDSLQRKIEKLREQYYKTPWWKE